jgi:hypothetical protein
VKSKKDVACPAAGTYCTSMDRAGYQALRGNQSRRASVVRVTDIARSVRKASL